MSDKRKKENPLLVTCGIIEKNGRFLITQRPNNEGRENGGRWEFPGGRYEFDKDSTDLRKCLERELFEEMGIKVEVRDCLDVSLKAYDFGRVVALVGYHCEWISGVIEHKDVADHKWVTIIEMDKYDITEADIPLVMALLHKHR